MRPSIAKIIAARSKRPDRIIIGPGRLRILEQLSAAGGRATGQVLGYNGSGAGAMFADLIQHGLILLEGKRYDVGGLRMLQEFRITDRGRRCLARCRLLGSCQAFGRFTIHVKLSTLDGA